MSLKTVKFLVNTYLDWSPRWSELFARNTVTTIEFENLNPARFSESTISTIANLHLEKLIVGSSANCSYEEVTAFIERLSLGACSKTLKIIQLSNFCLGDYLIRFENIEVVQLTPRTSSREAWKFLESWKKFRSLKVEQEFPEGRSDSVSSLALSSAVKERFAQLAESFPNVRVISFMNAPVPDVSSFSLFKNLSVVNLRNSYVSFR